ncbi:MAG: phage antirepressor N-terminal domain-containing protein [Ktedonobacteraceae bacterium]
MPEEQTLIPIQQDTVDFDGFPVIGVRLPDGRIGASLRDMCEAMKIDRPSQVLRIRGDETIANNLVSVQVQTRGGPQVADFLTAWAIPYWLTGIDLPRIQDEKKRHTIALFKQRAADVLYQHFAQPASLSHAIVPTEPAPPAPGASALALAEYHRQMAEYFEWKAATDTRLDQLETWQESVEDRLESHEHVLGLVSDILERLGPETLTPAHQRQVQAFVKQLSGTTGKHSATIYDELKTAFEVPRYQDIPEFEWEKIAHWFRVQLQGQRKR